MFLPIGTDAPLYHRPFGTIGLITANVVTFWLTSGGMAFRGWILEPQHIDPLEWLSSAFLHFGLMHLLGNMIFLWIFGLIVEGKLGWWKFLALYVVLCAVDGLVTQILFLNYDGPCQGAGGASGVVYALMAISLVWAPKNIVEVLMCWIGFWSRAFHQLEVTVLTFSLFYIGIDFVTGLLLRDFEMTTPVLHVLGAGVGFPIGAFLLRKGWVECEGWDLFSVLRGDHLTTRIRESYRYRGPVETLVRDSEAEQKRQCDPAKELKKIRNLISQGQAQIAWFKYRRLRKRFLHVSLDGPELRSLIELLCKWKQWQAGVTLLDEYMDHVPQQATQARLMQAGILAKELERPRAALRVLDLIPEKELSPKQRRNMQSIRRFANRQLDEGVIELQQDESSASDRILDSEN